MVQRKGKAQKSDESQDKSDGAAPKKKGPGGRRPGAGRPAFKPTDADRDKVRSMAMVGIPQEDICKCIRPDQGGIGMGTLHRHFKDELARGAPEANARVAGRLFAIATQTEDLKAAATAGIYWTKARMGWSDRLEIGNKDGEAFKVEHDMPPVQIMVAPQPDGDEDGDDGDAGSEKG